MRPRASRSGSAAPGTEVSIIAENGLQILADTGRNLYRIAQEAVNNALKHSRAGRVRVGISKPDESSLRMTIGDDGIGMEVPGTVTDGANGLGLRTMQYRAEVAGGSLRFESGRGGGTRILCDVPCVSPEGVQPAEPPSCASDVAPAPTAYTAFATGAERTALDTDGLARGAM